MTVSIKKNMFNPYGETICSEFSPVLSCILMNPPRLQLQHPPTICTSIYMGIGGRVVKGDSAAAVRNVVGSTSTKATGKFSSRFNSGLQCRHRNARRENRE